MAGPIMQGISLLRGAHNNTVRAIALTNQAVAQVNEALAATTQAYAGIGGSPGFLAALTVSRQELAKYGVVLQKAAESISSEIIRLTPRS